MYREIFLLFHLIIGQEIDSCPFQCQCKKSEGQFITNCGNVGIRYVRS